MNENGHTLQLSKQFPCNCNNFVQLIPNGTLFRLTGAQAIKADYRTGGKFSLEFNNRGIISGSFIIFSNSEFRLDWNVEGFGRPSEKNTLVNISVNDEEQNCRVVLVHSNILNQESLDAKKKAWAGIFEELALIITNSSIKK